MLYLDGNHLKGEQFLVIVSFIFSL
ncbi:hypothetical protein Gotur_012446, partial [Gossypium turneri]